MLMCVNNAVSNFILFFIFAVLLQKLFDVWLLLYLAAVYISNGQCLPIDLIKCATIKI